MFPVSYFCAGLFAPRFFPEVGAAVAVAASNHFYWQTVDGMYHEIA